MIHIIIKKYREKKKIDVKVFNRDPNFLMKNLIWD